MRAREPDRTGYAVNDGVRIYYEVCGNTGPTILFVPGFQVMHGRAWKMQVPFLTRTYRTVVYDGRGAGLSDHPSIEYGKESQVNDALAVMDELGIARFAIIAVSSGARPAAVIAARHPDRVSGLVLVGPSINNQANFSSSIPVAERRARLLSDFDGWARDFWATIFTEPHSTKALDDGLEYTRATNARTLTATIDHGWGVTDALAEFKQARCPVLLIHGTQDGRVPYEYGAELHSVLPQCRLVTIANGGHFPMVRDPVRINLLLREFFDRDVAWTVAARVS
jgi:pimeloyl-ACP methyl ester carboxylesterase